MLYRDLADTLLQQIDRGVYPVGTSLPGLRRLSRQHRVSVSTAVSACRELERLGRVQARSRSGYYVLAPPAHQPMPRPRSAGRRPRPVTSQQRVLQLVQSANDPGIVNLGAAIPDPDFMPTQAIANAYRQVFRYQRRRCSGYELPPGAPELRTQIARHLAGMGAVVDPDQVLITNSCQEAITIALKQLTRPGDVVVLESPSYYGLLQVVESLGLEVLEVPSDPQTGLSMAALARALEQWPVRACVLATNHSNPLGVCLSDERKRELLELLSQHEVPLVEDDIYGDLPFGGPRPRPVKSWDTRGLVYYCSSASKTLSAGMRVGWLVPGGDSQRSEYLQFINTVSVNTPGQLALAHVLEHHHYERLMRPVAAEHARSVARMSEWVGRLFPRQTRVSRPAGGFVLWVELPGEIDTGAYVQAALESGVSFAPGSLFSASGRFANCLRVNCAVRWDARVERALETLAGFFR